jgi:uncharacterized protein (TIGR02266 family)
MDEQGRRTTDRKAVGLLVKLKHSDVGSFIEEFATNLSPGGMFIRSRQPQPVGTPVKFEVQIAGGVRVLRGAAVVRWIRQPDDPAGPPGMGVQFTEVDGASQALIDVMLQRSKAQAAAGGAPPVLGAESRSSASLSAAPPVLGAESRSSASLSVAPAIAPVSGPGSPAITPVVAPVVPPAATRSSPGMSVAPAVAPLVPPGPSRSSPGMSVAPAAQPFTPPTPGLGPTVSLPHISVAGRASRPAEAVDIPIDELLSRTPTPVSAGPSSMHPAASAPSSPGRPAWTQPDRGMQEIELDLSEAVTSVPASAPAAAGSSPAWAQPDRGMQEFDLNLSDMVAPPPPRAPAPVPAAMPRAPEAAAAPRPAPVLAPVAPPAPAVPQAVPVLQQQTPLATRAPGPAPTPGGAPRPVFLTPPAQITGTGPVIGIDLGTTNSCVAVMSNGRPLVLRSKEGYNTIPSVVSLTAQGKLLVSHRAKNQLVLRPSHTIYGAKRLVGRPYDSAVVRQVRERFHYEIFPDAAGRAAVRLGENVLSLEEVQGLILKECKEMAESHLRQPVERAVVTVPAYYSEPQREAVRKAGFMAGLKVERILNEPTSAALAYGLNRELSKKVLVYDLGGGTFDATVLRVEKNVFEVLGTGGDVFLGGLDFDNLVVDLLLERFQQQEKLVFSGDNIALSRVSDAAERAKVALSERNTYDVHIPMLMMDEAGRPHDLRCTLHRAEVEAVCLPLIQRTLDVVRDVLLDAKLKVSDVDDIILVGGQSRMPLVRDKLKELFGKPALASVNADEAVALGAALYSGTVDKVSSVVLIDVLPMTIGVAMPGGTFMRVIERNTPLPAQRSFNISTTRDNEEALELSVFQGEDSHIAANEYLGTVRIEGLPRANKGAVKVTVTLRLDSECVLHVQALEHISRKEVRATLATRYTPEELQKKLGVNKEQAQAAEERRGKDLKDRSGRFWGFLKKVVGRG